MKIIENNHASAYPVAIFIICLGVASFLILLFGPILEPFFNLAHSEDSTIDSEISTPRGYVDSFMQIFWPKGLLIVILLGLSLGLLMEYQKSKYQRG